MKIIIIINADDTAHKSLVSCTIVRISLLLLFLFFLVFCLLLVYSSNYKANSASNRSFKQFTVHARARTYYYIRSILIECDMHNDYDGSIAMPIHNSRANQPTNSNAIWVTYCKVQCIIINNSSKYQRIIRCVSICISHVISFIFSNFIWTLANVLLYGTVHTKYTCLWTLRNIQRAHCNDFLVVCTPTDACAVAAVDVNIIFGSF